MYLSITKITHFFFSQMAATKNVMFLILKLSNLSLISQLKNTKLYINFSFFFSWLSNWFILFLQVFHYMVIILHSFKGRFINHIIFFHLVTFCWLKLLTFEKFFGCFKILFNDWSFLMFWNHLNAFGCASFFRSETDAGDLQESLLGSLLTFNALEFWKTSGGVFSHASSFITDTSVLEISINDFSSFGNLWLLKALTLFPN